MNDTSKHSKRIWFVVIACVLCVGVISGFFLWRAQAKTVKYATQPVRRGDISSAVQATGTINPITTVPVGSFISGTVQYIFADFNSRVREGQVLAQLDPALYQAQLITARGNLANAKANVNTLEATLNVEQAALNKTQADLAYAVVNAKRTNDLFKDGVVSTDQNDLTQSVLGQKEADVRAAQAAVEQGKAQLQQAKAQLEAVTGTLRQAETNLKYTTILSPIDGTVVARNITVGQSVAASLQAPNVFTIAQDLTRMQVYAKTDESDTGNITAGTDVTFQVDAFPGELFRGRVSAVRLNAYTVQNVVTYDTVITFDNENEKLLPGETAYVTIPTGHVTNALRLPNAALTFTPDLPTQTLRELYHQYNISRDATTTHLGGWQVVWKLGSNEQPIPAAVRLRITDFTFTEVREGDLREGDAVITFQQNGAQTKTQAAPGLGQSQSQTQRGPR
jgi:HlyD family secretion protein